MTTLMTLLTRSRDLLLARLAETADRAAPDFEAQKRRRSERFLAQAADAYELQWRMRRVSRRHPPAALQADF